ncbi:MAG: sensor histidine kinase [Marinifilaceae bacterium]|jgi:hypothetical protein|nr:sensor histidine kinase [Marinifilaceae bacterium]
MIKINEKYLVYVILVVIWIMLFLDNYNGSLIFAILIASVRVFVVGFIYYVHHKTYLYLNTSIKECLKLAGAIFVAFIILSIDEIFTEAVYINSDSKIANFINKFSSFYDENNNNEDILDESNLLMELFLNFLSSSIQIISAIVFSWATHVMKKNKINEMEISKLENLKKEAELSHLKNQINPHFLFNALSNIYSLAYLKEDETPDRIMQLSKMLRYVVYETNVDKVNIEKEVNYIITYIDFVMLKTNNKNIKFEYNNCDLQYKLPPMILMPFIENAFKHSIIGLKFSWIKIVLENINPKGIMFRITNSVVKNEISTIYSNGGVGIENVKKRLEIEYKDKFSLKNGFVNEKVYEVELKLYK